MRESRRKRERNSKREERSVKIESEKEKERVKQLFSREQVRRTDCDPFFINSYICQLVCLSVRLLPLIIPLKKVVE